MKEETYNCFIVYICKHITKRNTCANMTGLRPEYQVQRSTLTYGCKKFLISINAVILLSSKYGSHGHVYRVGNNCYH